MSKEIDKLIKIQGKINKNLYHLHVHTDLEEFYEWRLYRVFQDIDKYFSEENRPILDSRVDSIDDLMTYLTKHDGFDVRW